MNQYGYADIWIAEFRRQFSELHNWKLEEISNSSKMTRKPHGWFQFREYGEVDFCCTRCCRTWFSSHGAVVFYCWSAEPRRSGGLVSVELLGQKCKQCGSLRYETPQWTREEVSEVISSLLVKVKAKYYGIKSPQRQSRNQHPNERTSNGPHLPNLCQACENGVCTKNKKVQRNAVDMNNYSNYPSTNLCSLRADAPSPSTREPTPREKSLVMFWYVCCLLYFISPWPWISMTILFVATIYTCKQLFCPY